MAGFEGLLDVSQTRRFADNQFADTAFRRHGDSQTGFEMDM